MLKKKCLLSYSHGSYLFFESDNYLTFCLLYVLSLKLFVVLDCSLLVLRFQSMYFVFYILSLHAMHELRAPIELEKWRALLPALSSLPELLWPWNSTGMAAWVLGLTMLHERSRHGMAPDPTYDM